MLDFPKKKYNIIYADPPWAYNNFQGKGKNFGDVSAHYQTMSTADICGLPVQDISDTNCILFLWTTCPNLDLGLKVISGWGFKYKTVGFSWVKTRGDGFYSGLGFYTNSNIELCLIGTKGKFNRNARNVKQLLVSPLREYSRKPDEVRDRILALCGDLPRIELFARQQTSGWDVWGNQINSGDTNV